MYNASRIYSLLIVLLLLLLLLLLFVCLFVCLFVWLPWINEAGETKYYMYTPNTLSVQYVFVLPETVHGGSRFDDARTL